MLINSCPSVSHSNGEEEQPLTDHDEGAGAEEQSLPLRRLGTQEIYVRKSCISSQLSSISIGISLNVCLIFKIILCFQQCCGCFFHPLIRKPDPWWKKIQIRVGIRDPGWTSWILFLRTCVGQSTTQLPVHQNSLMATRAIPCFCLPPGTAQWRRNLEVKRFIRATVYSVNICRQS